MNLSPLHETSLFDVFPKHVRQHRMIMQMTSSQLLVQHSRGEKKNNNASRERTIDSESRGFVFPFHSPRVSRAFRCKLPGPLSFPLREENKQRLGPMLTQMAWALV